MSRKRNSPQVLAKRIVIQMLFASADVFTFDGLQRHLREVTAAAADPQVREAGRLTLDQVVLLCQELQQDLAPLGLQLLHASGGVRLATGLVEIPALQEWLSSCSGCLSPHLSEEAMATLVCIATKQPVTLAEINEFFGVDRSELVLRLGRLGLVQRQHGGDGRLVCSVTEEFLRVFKLSSVQELRDKVSQIGASSKAT